MAIPVLLLSHAPGQSTGLSRIATDLAARLWVAQQAGVLPIDLLHVGSVGWGPLPRGGVPVALPVAWPCHVWQEEARQDLSAVLSAALARWPAETPGVLFIVTDPARAYEILAALPKAARLAVWLYTPIDAHNVNGSIGGPAAFAIRQADRVLACSPFGQRVLATLRDDVAVIPHGFDPAVFQPLAAEDHAGALRAQQLLDPTGSGQMVLGCVATNQARKDWGLFFATLKLLRTRGVQIRGWAHVDQQIGPAWSLPQLAEDFGLDWTALTVTEALSDQDLARCYSRCVATLAIGRGEGFGYPILESLACGTPVAHVNYGGGANFDTIKLAAHAMPLVGPYALQRPVVEAAEAAEGIGYALAGGWSQRLQAVAATRAYTWDRVWPQFEAWVRTGLEALR